MPTSPKHLKEQGGFLLLSKQATMKLKPLMPTLRERKRYIAFEIIAERPISCSACAHALQQASIQMFGTIGTAAMGMRLLSRRYQSNTGIIRVSHTHCHQARAVLAYVDRIEGINCVIRSIQTSGMVQRAVDALYKTR